MLMAYITRKHRHQYTHRVGHIFDIMLNSHYGEHIVCKRNTNYPRLKNGEHINENKKSYRSVYGLCASGEDKCSRKHERSNHACYVSNQNRRRKPYPLVIHNPRTKIHSSRNSPGA